jgi:hypothetical protein
MKTHSSFNMKKETKRLLAVTPAEKRPFMKQMMIEAQVAEAKAKMAKVRDNNQGDE